MKLIMTLGGLLGFGIGLVFSWAAGSPWPSVLWRASVAAFVSGVLLRWWGRVWLKALQQSHREKQAALQASLKSEPKPFSTPAK